MPASATELHRRSSDRLRRALRRALGRSDSAAICPPVRVLSISSIRRALWPPTRCAVRARPPSELYDNNTNNYSLSCNCCSLFSLFDIPYLKRLVSINGPARMRAHVPLPSSSYLSRFSHLFSANITIVIWF